MNEQLKKLYRLVLGNKWKIHKQNLNPHWRLNFLKENNIKNEYHIELESPHGMVDSDIYLAEIR